MKKRKFIMCSCQALETHPQGVGEKAGQFTAKIGLPEVGELLGLLHDLGKYSQVFQNYSHKRKIHNDK